MGYEPEYISVNRIAYDHLAKEYRARAASDRIRDEAIVAPFVRYLSDRFGVGARVLDIGPGNGVNLAMLAQHGFNVYGIDLSKQMIKVAQQNAPSATLKYGNFLEVDYSKASFEGIFSKASIHLFPKKDAEAVLGKITDLLVAQGIFYVTTTVAQRAQEGFATKDDYAGATVRFRKLWTPDELRRAVTRAGLRIREESFNDELERGKQWFNIWAVKT